MNPELTKLTPRTYLGDGYFHWFKNDKTGEEVTVECTQEEYEALGLPGAGPAVLEGHTWLSSAGGTVKVDTPSGFLGENEYTVRGGEKVVRTAKEEVLLPPEAVDAEHNIDMANLVTK